MKRLIVSADDFGLTKTINQGIAGACRDGIVTSVNLIPTGEAFADAVRLMKDLGLGEAGAHLAFTETSPLAGARGIRTLITLDGRFHKNRNLFLLRFLAGRIDLDELYRELKSQMDVIAMAGLRITDLSSHEHLHMIPAVLDIFIKLAKEYDVPAIRFPHSDWSALTGMEAAYRRIILAFFEKGVGSSLRAAGMIFPDHFRGLLDSGRMTEEALLAAIRSLDEGTTELVCHPGLLGPEVRERYGFHMNCETELSALTSARVKELLRERDITLIRYGEFLSDR